MLSLLKSLYNHKRLVDAVKEEVAKEYKIPKKALNIPVRYALLPWLIIKKGFSYLVGKILGVYAREKKEILIDYSLWFKSLFSYNALKTYIKTLAEEFAHAAQDYLGKLKAKRFDEYIKNYENDENEIEAKRVANKVADRVLNLFQRNKSYFGYKLPFYSLLSLF